jgi:O-antigen ligase
MKDRIVKYCDWLVGVFLFLFAFWSPISVTGAEASISLALLFWLVKMTLEGKLEVVKNPLNLPVASFLVIAGVGALLGTDARYSLKAYSGLCWMTMFFLVATNVNDERRFKRLIGVLVLIVTIAGAYAIFQHFSRADFLGNLKYLRKSLGRSPGFFNSPQTFGNYLLLAFPLVLGLSFYGNQKEKRWFQLSTVPLLAGILFSYVRGVWIGVVCGLLVMGMLRSRKFLFYLVAIMGVVILVFFSLPSLKFSRRIVKETFKSSRPLGDRLDFWKGSLRIIRDYPVMGVGWEGFRLVYPRYEPKASQQPACHAHNNFMDIGVGSGLVGLGVFIWLILVAYKYAWEIYKRQAGYFKGIAWGFLGSLTAFLIGGLSQYNFGDSEVVMLFYFLLGMVMVIPGIVNRDSYHSCGFDEDTVEKPLTGSRTR